MKSRIGFTGFLAIGLTIAFVVLKVMEIIAWPWWLVFAPAWAYGALVMTAMVVLVIFIAIAAGARGGGRR